MTFSSYIYSLYKPVCNLVSNVVSIERKIDSSEAFERIGLEALYSDGIDRKPLWGGLSRGPIYPQHSSLKKIVSQFEKEGVREKIALDLGCGKAHSTLYLLEKGWKVIALDYSQEALDNLQEVANRINPDWISKGQLTLACEDIENYSLPPNVTLIVASRILPYLNPLKVKALWDRLYDTLAPGGRIVGHFYSRLAFRSFSELGERATTGVWFTDMASVQALLAHKNYQIEDCDYGNFWFIRQRNIEFTGRKQENPSNQKGLFSIRLSSYYDAVRGLPEGLFHHFIPFLADRLIELKEISKLTSFVSGAITLTQALMHSDTTVSSYAFAGSISAWFIFKNLASWMESKAHAHIMEARNIIVGGGSQDFYYAQGTIKWFQDKRLIQQLLNPPPPSSSNPLEEIIETLKGIRMEIRP